MYRTSLGLSFVHLQIHVCYANFPFRRIRTLNVDVWEIRLGYVSRVRVPRQKEPFSIGLRATTIIVSSSNCKRRCR